MKKVIELSLTTALFGVLILTSCSKQDAPAPTPTFIGTWHVSENSKDYGASTYNCTISDSSDATHLLFTYLYGFNKKIYGTHSGSNVTIPSQSVQGNSVSGSGVLANANRINLSYWVRTTTTHYDTVTAVLTK